MLAGEQPPADVTLRAGIEKESVEGDLRGAIALYERASREAGSDRALAARALLAAADAYRKLGDPRAQATYRSVVSRYADLPAAASARAHLSTGDAPARRAGESGSSRAVMRMPDGLHEFGGGTVSRDGRWLPATDWSTGDLALIDLKDGSRTRLTDTATFASLAEQQYAGFSRVSPDGRSIAFGWFNSKRYEVRLVEPRAGAVPRTVYHNEDVEYVQPFDWSPDGTRLVVQLRRTGGTGQIAILSVSDGRLTTLKSFPWKDDSTHVVFSPDGRAIGYDVPTGDDPGIRDVFVIAADGSREVPVAAHRRNDEMVGWSADGTRLLFASDRAGSRQLWAQPMAGLEPNGTPTMVPSEFRGHAMGLTRDGSLYYHASTYAQSAFRLVDFDFATGLPAGTPADPGEEFYSINNRSEPAWSADGQLALSRRDRGGPMGMLVSIVSADGTQVRHVRPQLSAFGPLRWDADNAGFIVAGADTKRRQGLFRVDATSGSATALLVSTESDSHFVPARTADGRELLYRHVNAAAVRLVARDVRTGVERTLISRSVAGGAPATVLSGLLPAPDTSWLATTTREADGSSVVHAVSVGSGEDRPLLRAQAGASVEVLMWAPDGRTLFVRRREKDRKPEVLRLALDGTAAPPVPWTLGDETGGFMAQPGGSRVVFVERSPSASGAYAELRTLPGVGR